MTGGPPEGEFERDGHHRRLNEGRIDIHGVAQLSGLPQLLRGVVRRAFRSNLKYPVTLDWSGRVSGRYGHRGGRAALYVIDRGGRIHLTKTGAATPGDLEEVFLTVERLMK